MMKATLALIVVGFVVFCGWLVVESGFFEQSSEVQPGCILLQNIEDSASPATQDAPAADAQQMTAAKTASLGAEHAPAKTMTLGSVDPNSGYKFRIELTSKGAAIRTVTFSKWDNRNPKNPQPLEFVSPMTAPGGSEVLVMANTALVFVEEQLQLPLDKLEWQSSEPQTKEDGSQTARFEATINNKTTGEPVLKLTKTYTVRKDTYLFDCDIVVENLTGAEEKVRFNMTGPGGVNREGFRRDMRSVIAAFRDLKGGITSAMHDERALAKAKTVEKRELDRPGAGLLWAAAVNKYFAAIAVPLPHGGQNYCSWIKPVTGELYYPEGASKTDDADKTVAVDLAILPSTLAARDQAGNSETYNFQLYFGPKSESLFKSNKEYRDLGFVQTITFMGCCCPAWIISPLAFGILAIMKWMHVVIPNYGVVIIILVFLMRLVMHPITKKSQVSMSKMGTLAPKVEEIKKKYANNKTEMNKQMMALYREQGASPVMGMLPMFVQMPIWIALWSAVYTSIDLRGAAFLPFWITDLSVPDAAWTFPHPIAIPLLGWKIYSLNLLPILMGVAFYLQQQLMPSQASAATNPQVAQQQKMMKIMMPVLFPLMLYNGPSGVNLYIMASTFAGVVEQHVIRKHIREKEQAESKGLVAATSKTGGKAKKKKPKPFFKNM
jgi:YidC/Oxa1 family membrane protein insertase